MFEQVISGRVRDPAQLRARMERWIADLSPAADGWLGSTTGVTADGIGVALARFESAEAARRNSDRPEQGQWWAETAPLFDGDVTFHDCSDVHEFGQGGSDRAGFVQVMQGRGTDSERAKQLMTEDSDKWAAFRPEVIGSVAVGHDGGAYTMVMYFTSEADAREGERKEIPPELQANMDEMNKLSIGEPEFFDLKQPILSSPD